MKAPQVTNSATWTPSDEATDAGAKASPIIAVALVAVLAGFVLVDLAMQRGTASGPPSPESDIAAAIAAPGAAPDPQIRLAIAPARDESSGQRAPQSGLSGGNIIGVAAAAATPAATEIYLPAQYTNQAKSIDGNVMTFEHD